MMKLNADILFSELERAFPVKSYGNFREDLTLSRLRLYESSKRLSPDTIYVSSNASSLPVMPPDVIPGLIICSGGEPAELWCKSGIPMIIVMGKEDFVFVFNTIQDILDRFDQWDDKIQQILSKDADPQKMVQATTPLLSNPIIIVDKNLNILAASAPKYWIDQNHAAAIELSPGHIPPYYASKMRDLYWGYLKNTEPFLHNDEGRYGDQKVYSVNIFSQGKYEGNVSLIEAGNPLRNGDLALFRYFAKYADAAVQKRISIIHGSGVTLQKILKKILDGCQPEDQVLTQAINAVYHNRGRGWICFVLTPFGPIKPFPIDYVCATLAEYLPGCIAFGYEEYVLSVIQLSDYTCTMKELVGPIESYLKSMDFRMAVSCPFRDIRTLPVYYRQAKIALVSGQAHHPERQVNLFSDEALSYMLSLCKMEIEPEDLFPPELKLLRELNAKASVDYWETLRVYLDHECNAAHTAQALFLHRTTLLQRLGRIKKIPELNLDSPEKRLYYRICLWLGDQYGVSHKQE